MDPKEKLAQKAVTGLRMLINEDRNRQREQSIGIHTLPTSPTLMDPFWINEKPGCQG